MKLLLTTLSLLLVVQAGFCDIYTYPAEDPIFEIAFPDNWNIETEDEVLHATPKDESIYLMLWAVDEAETFEQALQIIDEVVNDLVPNLEVDDPELIEHNNMELLVITGSGSDEGVDLNAELILFSPDGETVFVVFYFATPEAEELHASELTKIQKSLKAK